MAAFTGLVYCAAGHKCYRARSVNAKNSYDYYVSSRHQRYGDCPHCRRMREDVLMEFVKGKLAAMFRQSDQIIARAIEIETEGVRANRDEASRLKSELADANARQAWPARLLPALRRLRPARAHRARARVGAGDAQAGPVKRTPMIDTNAHRQPRHNRGWGKASD